jgi:hypothetical protein
VGKRIWAQLECTTIGVTPSPPSGRYGARPPLDFQSPRPFRRHWDRRCAPVEALGVEDGRVRNADRCHGAQMEMSASLHVGLLWRKYLLRWPRSSIGGTKPQS